MNTAIEHVDLDDLIELSMLLFGEPAPIRDIGLLNSAAARAQTVAFGHEAYRDVWSKAAALLDSLVTNKALVQGDKILGWLATAVFLELNQVPASSIPKESVFDLVMAVAAGDLTVETIASRLRLAANGVLS